MGDRGPVTPQDDPALLRNLTGLDGSAMLLTATHQRHGRWWEYSRWAAVGWAGDMVILRYPRDSAGDASRKIDEIRAAYTRTFHQESVLREDELPSCVSF